jgi:hypothetical protein
MTGLIGGFIPGFYAKIVRQPAAKTIGFLLVFILTISAALSLKSALDINPRLKYIQEWSNGNLKKIPPVEVKNGTLIQPKDTYVLEIGGGFPVFAVEPDRKKEADILDKYKNVIMLTLNQVVFKQAGQDFVADERRRDLDKDRDWRISPNESGFVLAFDNNQISVTPVTVKKWLKVAAILLFPSFLLILFFFYCFTKPLQVLFFSLIGLSANAILKTRASYGQVLNVCTYALVPPAIIAVLVEAFHLRLPGFWFLFCSIYILYIFLGLQSAKCGEKAADQGPPEF